MVSMTRFRLGASRCPKAAYAGSGAQAAYGWVQHVELIPLFVADQGTSVSAPSERSP
jgi:hypothetical protein